MKLINQTINKLNNHNHNKYIDTSEFNKLAADIFNARLAQANLITKTDFDAKLSNLNRKITQNKSKHLLVENKLNKLKTFDSSYFIGKSHFEEDGTQNYLVFQPSFRYFKLNVKTATILSWKSKGLSAATIEPHSTSNIGLIVDFYGGGKLRVKFSGGYLKQPQSSYNHKKVVNIYIAYELSASSCCINDPALKKCLFGGVILTKNAYIDNYGYSGYGIGFDRRSIFSFPGVGFGQSVLILSILLI